MKNSIIKSIFSFVLMSVLCFFTAISAFAAENCTLDVIYKYNETVFEGVSVKIYKIAEYGKDELVPLGSFKNLNINKTKLDSSVYVRSIEDEIENIIANSSLTPDYSSTTNSNGEVSFTSLGYGLYYIAAAPYSENSNKYFFSDSAFLINPKTIESGSSVMEIKPKAAIDTSVDKKSKETEKTKTTETTTAYVDEKNDKSKQRLPQTGLQLNIVAALIISGTALIFIGVRVKKNES